GFSRRWRVEIRRRKRSERKRLFAWAGGIESTSIHFAPLLTTPACCGQYIFTVLFSPAQIGYFPPPAMPVFSRVFPLLLLAAPIWLFGQTDSPSDAVRVSVRLNPDGSRTVYEADNVSHKSVATTTGKDGKVREKIRYDLDEGGRFRRGEVYGPKEQA